MKRMRGSAGSANEPGRAPSFADEWSQSYGRYWWTDLACLGLIVFALGAIQPLSDPDLPMHLATGEWIVKHRAVPFVEPFAWTRTGAPYYAYSWLPEVAYYIVLRYTGFIGLHLLDGAVLLSAASAMLMLARSARWKPWVALCMAGANVGIAMMVVSKLRPQLVLFALVPAAWALTYRILYRGRVGWSFVGLVAVCAVAANSHIFFILTAAPLALIVARPPADWRRGALAAGAIGVAWLLSPYGLSWPDVFRLNFGYNALLQQPSPIREFGPGFRPGLWLPWAIALAAMPWALSSANLDRRERLVYATLWLVGLVTFGYAVRLLLCWWLTSLPLVAATLQTLERTERSGAPRLVVKVATYLVSVTLLIAIGTAMVPAWKSEGRAGSRSLPVEASTAIEPVLRWLECNSRTNATGRVYTWFNYGSYITWRLPGFSPSIDGRTIFPDSVAKPEVFVSGLVRPPAYRVWQSADLAILPRNFGVAALLDSAAGWRLAAVSNRPGAEADSVGLWVKSSWWIRAGAGPLPDRAARLSAESTAHQGGCSMGDDLTPCGSSVVSGCPPGR